MNGLSRYQRVLKFIDNLEKEKPLKNKEEVKKLRKKLEFTGYKLKTFETIRIITVILLYSSITSTVLSIIPGFEAFSKNIVYISSLIGSTFFLIIVGITTKFIGLYMIDLNLISSQIIAIYNKKR